jgi:hypothetical protein
VIKKRICIPVLILLTLFVLSGCLFSMPTDHISKIEGDITYEYRAGEDATHWAATVNTDAVFDREKFVELYNEDNRYDPVFYKKHLNRLDLRIIREEQPEEYEKIAGSEVNFGVNFTDKNGHDLYRHVSLFRYESKMYFFKLCMGGASKPEEIGYYYKEVPAKMAEYWTPIYEEVLADKEADRWENYGSFTMEKTYSYDRKFYARNMPLSTEMMEIEIFDDNGVTAEFQPCWESNFRGICWEKDNYNIWVQTRGSGYICYSLRGNEWVENKDAVMPDYITGRYG